MTGIAAMVRDGEVWMAGDRAAVDQDHYLEITASPKVFQKGPFVFGYTSSFRMGEALKYRLTLPELPTDGLTLPALERYLAVEFADAVRALFREIGFLKIENSKEWGGIFLLGGFGHIFTFDDDLTPRRHMASIAATGSGISVIQGALYVTHTSEWPPHVVLHNALTAASEFVTGVRGPFDVICAPTLTLAE